MIDVVKISKRVTETKYRTFIDDIYKQWKHWDMILFNLRLSKDLPIIIIKEMISKELVTNPKSAPIESQKADSNSLAVIAASRCDEYREWLRWSGDSHLFGIERGDPYKGRPPVYKVCGATLTGENGYLSMDDECREGRWLFMLDSILHEMIHHYVMRIYGPNDHLLITAEEAKAESEADEHRRDGPKSPWLYLRRTHSRKFCETCNIVAKKLGLTEIKYFVTEDEERKHPCQASYWFPHTVRSVDYYQGAVRDANILHRPSNCRTVRRFEGFQSGDECMGCDPDAYDGEV